MAQTFDPTNVMLSDSIGQEIVDAGFTQEFLQQLVQTSKVVQLGQRVEMGNQKMIRRQADLDELTDAYFVGEGEKIGTAKIEGTDYTLEAKKIGVILPVTEEFLNYTWADYFNEVVPAIVDKFNKKIDGAAFLGLHNNPFGANILAQATTAENVISGGLSLDTILDLETTTPDEPNAFVGHRTLKRGLRGVVDEATGQYVYDADNSSIDGLPYHELKLAKGETYPDGTLITGDFNGLKYGVPQGTSLRLKIGDQATLSTVQNAGPDSGDVHLFEQDMQALRAVFEIAVAVPQGENFAVIEAGEEEPAV